MAITIGEMGEPVATLPSPPPPLPSQWFHHRPAKWKDRARQKRTYFLEDLFLNFVNRHDKGRETDAE